MARARASAVPGLRGSQRSAFSARSVLRGSTTMSFAPLFLASRISLPLGGWDATGLAPQTIIQLDDPIVRAYLQHDRLAHGDCFREKGRRHANMKVDADAVRASERKGDERACEGRPGARPVNRGYASGPYFSFTAVSFPAILVKSLIPRYPLPLEPASLSGASERIIEPVRMIEPLGLGPALHAEETLYSWGGSGRPLFRSPCRPSHGPARRTPCGTTDMRSLLSSPSSASSSR